MKKNFMRILALACVFILSGNLLTAQNIGIGVRAGANFSNIVSKDANDNVWRNNINPGFHVGVTYDLPLAGVVYLQPAALFSTKGYSSTSNSATTDSKYSETPYYLEVPVNLLLKPEIGPDRLLVGFGPYVAYGLGGKWKDKMTGSGSNTETGKLEFINDWKDESDKNDVEAYGKKVDFGLNVLGGYEFSNSLSIQLNGQYGLANLRPNVDGKKPENSFKNIGFGISLGYKF